jgi:uncharacterized membrane protein (DUF2068 family)
MPQLAEAAPPLSWRHRFFKASTLRLVYVRLLSLGFLALGLFQWAELLGAIQTGAPDFFTLTVQAQAILLFFAVANLVAAVGLWLLATWGIVVWFAAAGTRIVRHTVFASTFGWTPISSSAECLGIIVFAALIIFEARAEHREVIRQRETRRNRARD